MKNKKIIPLLFATFLLSGCTINLFPDSSSEMSSSIPLGDAVGFSVKDLNEQLKIGEIYSSKVKLAFFQDYSSGQQKRIDVLRYTIQSMFYNNSTPVSINEPFDRSGNYTVNVSFSYNLSTRNVAYEIYVKGGEELNYSANEINILNDSLLAYDGEVVDLTNIDYEIKYSTGSEIVKQYYEYDASQTFISCSLYKDGNKNNNVISLPLSSTSSYVLELRHVRSNVSTSLNLEVMASKGYYKIEKPTIISTDFGTHYAPSIGDIKVLVIPVQLPVGEAKNYHTWNENSLDFVRNAYFGTPETNDGWNSFASYYATASFNKLSFSGMVADIYEETDDNYSITAINSDKTYSKLYELLARALNSTKVNNPTVSWSDYDLNKDGYIDSIHFISNAGSDIKWNEPLWPHMSSAGLDGTVSNPGINTYSMSSLSHFSSARTQIHEQGHIFGLQDYYDYTSNSKIDYVGGADMQSFNMFDWNSYSKFTMGWNNPYVIDGTSTKTTITLSAASINGDCLIIPANIDTFNNSAFDEYFMLELFSPFGNNEYDWASSAANSYFNLTSSDFGVRLYHVDSRLYACDYYNMNNGYIVDDIDELNEAIEYKFVYVGANNSYDSSAYAYSSPDMLSDYKLLTLIQSGKVNTLGTSKNMMNPSDLFHTGDVFNFADYSSFLLKSNVPVSTMDNGETFPYTISFDKVEKTKVVVTITKNL